MTRGPGFIGLLSEAWLSIGSHPLRTFLAVLGIVIGVGAVVLMMAIGTGSARSVQKAVNSLGSNIVMVIPGNRYGRGPQGGRPARLDTRNATEIAQLPLVQATAPVSFPQSFPIAAGKFKGDVQVTAVTPDFFLVREWEFADGGSFTGDDLRNGARVAVLGATVVDKVFQGSGAIGRTVTIKGTPFQVVGVLKPKGQGIDGRDQDDAVFVPATTGASHLWGQQAGLGGIVRIIYVKAVSGEAMDEMTENIRAYLRQHFALPASAPDNFTIYNISSVAQVATDTAQAFSTLLGAIASISLLVGGIGIMNVMLVNITERTREIGIRKAVGATEQQILVQFLLEAVVIACVGSLVGLALGLGGGLVFGQWQAIPVEFEPSITFLALGVSALVGVASGLYPAYKAARMQPIEALRAVAA